MQPTSTPYLALFAALLQVPFVAAQSACSSTQQQYNDIAGFPNTPYQGCIPTNYGSVMDLGMTSPADAQTRCAARCNSLGSQCASWVAQVNKAADSNLYPSGSCFFFPAGQAPAAPRTCSDKAYLLVAGVKDNSLGCFTAGAASSSAAAAFCSSYLRIPVVTSVIYKTPAAISVTTTTSTTTSTTSLTTTSTTTTSVSTSVSIIATTTTSIPYRKRAIRTVAAPACITSDTPATRLSAACSCLSISTSTTITTSTVATPTSSNTKTATITRSFVSTTVSSVVIKTTTLTTTTASTTVIGTPPQNCNALPSNFVSNGKHFDIKCGYAVTMYRPITNIGSITFRACVDACAQTGGCIAAYWYTYGAINNYINCGLISSFGSSYAENANNNVALLQ